MATARTAQNLIDAALRSIGVLGSGESPTTQEGADGLLALQDLIGAWSTEGLVIPYINERQELTLTGGQTAYTIGTGGDFSTTRPIQILGAAGKGDGDVEYVYTLIDADTYRRYKLKSTGSQPYALWYNPVYPLGEIKIYPSPTGADTLYLDSLDPITEPTAVGTSVSLPEGYNRALRFNLALELASEYGRSATPLLVKNAADSKRAVKALNAAHRVETVKLEMLRLVRRFHINEG
jgi:hypothetical protein